MADQNNGTHRVCHGCFPFSSGSQSHRLSRLSRVKIGKGQNILGLLGGRSLTIYARINCISGSHECAVFVTPATFKHLIIPAIRHDSAAICGQLERV